MKSALFDYCDEDNDGFITIYEFKHCYCHPDEHHDGGHDENGGDENGGGGDNGGGEVVPQGCEGTAASLYEHFNVDNQHHELDIVEFITFYVTYYETD